MNIFDAHISGSLSVSSSAEISGNLNVLGTLSGSFEGDGSQLTNIPASGVTGLNLTQIADGTATASISQVNGFNVNTNINVSGSILPSVHVGENVSTYSLGSPTNAWHHLYISTGSIKFVNELGQEQGRITINPNSGQFNILSTSGLTESEITQIEAGNIPSSSLTDINIKSLNVYENIFASGSVTSSVFTGSFIGDGTSLYNIPASGVTGLNLTQIADGSATASISNTNGLRVNSNTEITGSLNLNNLSLGVDIVISNTVTDSAGKYYINGIKNPVLTFIKGFKYRFYNPNNGTHPILFSTTNDGEHNGGVAYTVGVTENVSPYYIEIEVTKDTPTTLYYYCDHHVGMGNSISITNDVLNNVANNNIIYIDPSRIATTGSNTFVGVQNVVGTQNVSGSINLTGSLNITGSISLNGVPVGTGKLDETTFNSYTSSNDSTNSTQNDRLTSIETSTGSLNTFSSSIDTTIKNKLNSDSVISGSVQVHVTGTTGYSTFSSSISTSIDSLSSSVATTTNNLSSSVATTTLNLKNRVDSVETSTGSLNSFTSSINTTIKDKMNADGVLSGSITFDISVIPGFTGLTNTVSSSISSSVSELSGSLTVTVTNLSSSLTNTDENQNNRIIGLETASGSLNSFTSSINTTIKSKLNTEGVISGSVQVNLTGTTGYSTFSSSIATTDLNQNNRLDIIEGKTGSYATTGSNIFQGSQTITGSLYVSQDLIVAGSSSIQHISSSIVNIADNIITVNASNPSLRFGGLAVIDSGSSPQVSGSILFDSVENQWVFIHQNQATVTSSMLIMGPETYDNVGNETHLTLNRLVKSVNDEHIGDSNITDTGTKVSINSNTEVTGTLNVTGIITNPNITAIETSTGSLNTFTSSLLTAIELTGSNLTVRGNFLVKGTTTNVNTTTLDVDNNLINLNGNGASFAGIRVKDTTGPILVSGSLLWDSANDYWIAGQLGSEQRLVRETEFNNAVTRIGNVETSTGSLNSFTGSINTTIKTKLNTEGVISGSVQVNHNATTNYDSNQHVDHTAVSISTGNGLSGGGTIAATRTLTLDTGSTHFTNGVKSKMNTDTVMSGSYLGTATTANLSENASYLYYTDARVKTKLNAEGVISGSAQVSYGSLSGTPASIVSGSVQVALTGTTGYGTYLNQSVLTSSSPTFVAVTATSGTQNAYLNYNTAAGVVALKSDIATAGTYTMSVGKAASLNNIANFRYNHAGGDGSTSNYVGIGFWSNDDLFRVYATGNATLSGTLRTAGATSNVVKYISGASSVTFGNSFGGSSTDASRTVFFRGTTGTASVWWGGPDANSDNIPHGAIDSVSTGGLTYWYNSAGTGGGTWTKIMTTDNNGVTVNSGNFIGNLTGNASGTALNITASSNTSLTSLANLATVGTISTGTWNGTSIGTAYTAAKVTAVNAGTGVGVDTTTGSVTVSIGQSVATSAVPTFKAAILTSDTDSRVLKLRELTSTSGNIIQFQDSAGTNKWEVVGRSNTDTTPFYIYKNDGTNNGYIFSISGSGIPNFHTALTIGGSTAKSFSNSSYSTTFSSVSSVTVTHSLGTKDVAVFVYDSSDNMFWPSSIVTTSTSVVTVTFASSRSGRVVVVR